MNYIVMFTFIWSLWSSDAYGFGEAIKDYFSSKDKRSAVEAINHEPKLVVPERNDPPRIRPLIIPKPISTDVLAQSTSSDDDLLSAAKSSPVKGASTVSQSPVEHDFDFDDLDTKENVMLRRSLKALPDKNRPADIDAVMKNIALGQKVLSDILAGNLGGAISLNIPTVGAATVVETHADQIVATALSSNDATFWQQIQNDTMMKKSITSEGVPFTQATFISPEFNMYFRLTYVRQNIHDPELLKKYKQAYEKSIVQLQWHLFAKAILQDHAFTSGMITFKDPQSRVFSFMDGYAELMSPNYKSHDGIGVHSLWADHAYTRESSHWNGQRAFEGKNFGIDIKGADGKPISILPGNKSHLLFGMRTNGMAFVKWEEYGTTFNVKTGDFSAIHHTLRYFDKRGLEDDPMQRREKMPETVLAKFKALYDKPLTSQQTKLIETDGISKMLQILHKDAPTKAAEFKNFLVVDMKYQANTLGVRKGGEIVLTLSPSTPSLTISPPTTPEISPVTSPTLSPKAASGIEINPDDL